MTAYGRFRKAQRMATTTDGGAGRKQARQEVLWRVRGQRMRAARKLRAKYGR